MPLSCGCLVVGLTIDYDIFLVSRIYDLKHEGLSTEEAILDGLQSSAKTITTAGIIMMVAFSSLLFSSTDVLHQFGFGLVASAFVDTFIVRTVLVPTMMFCAVDWNWWPGKVPEPVGRDAIQ